MKKVFMVHGFMGEPNGGWRPWLMGELAKKEVYACALPMPNPNNPIKGEWINLISESVENPNEEIYLVGHSLGSAAVLRYLESIPETSKIGGAILVSGPIQEIDKENQESHFRKIDNFLDKPFDFNHIKKVCPKFVVIHGDNDPKVPFSHAEKLSKNLDCKLITIPNGEHLNELSGFYQLPEVLQFLEEMLKYK